MTVRPERWVVAFGLAFALGTGVASAQEVTVPPTEPPQTTVPPTTVAPPETTAPPTTAAPATTVAPSTTRRPTTTIPRSTTTPDQLPTLPPATTAAPVPGATLAPSDTTQPPTPQDASISPWFPALSAAGFVTAILLVVTQWFLTRRPGRPTL